MSLADLAAAWLDLEADRVDLVRKVPWRERIDGEPARRLLASSAALCHRFVAARGLRVGDTVDVHGGVPALLGRPVGSVVRVNDKTVTVRLACEPGTRLVAADDLRLSWSTTVDVARDELLP